MTLTVNGIDMTPYVAAKEGIKWQRSDIEAQNAGRTLDGMMYRGRVGTKIRLDITCRPLSASELSVVMNAILPEYVTVTYDDPMYGRVTKSMYSNNTPASFLIRRADGSEWWSGITFPLIER